MNLDLPDSIQAALAEKHKTRFPVQDTREIETACREGKSIVIRSQASMNFMLWTLIVTLPLYNLIPWLQKKAELSPDEIWGLLIAINILAVGLFVPIHFFLNHELKKNVFIVSHEGIYARFRPFAKRLTQSPGPKARYRDMETLLDRDIPLAYGWVEKYLRWSDVGEVSEELTAQQPYGKGSAYRWPIFQITDAPSQAAEIRDKVASKLVTRLAGKDPRWEISIFLKGRGGTPLCLYLENYAAKGMRDVESLFLLSYLVNHYWRSSKKTQS